MTLFPDIDKVMLIERRCDKTFNINECPCNIAKEIYPGGCKGCGVFRQLYAEEFIIK